MEEAEGPVLERRRAAGVVAPGDPQEVPIADAPAPPCGVDRGTQRELGVPELGRVRREPVAQRGLAHGSGNSPAP